MTAPPATTSHKEPGSSWSYVLGFAFSLVLTVVAYYLVTNNAFGNGTIMAAILGLAILQMLVQIFFFLHLGRGPKPLYNVVFFIFTVITILVVVGGSIWIMNHLHYNMSPTETTKYLAEKEGIYQLGGAETGACPVNGANHKVTISNGQVSPQHIEAKLCDSLTFVNHDTKSRQMTFGTHPEHGTYSGEGDLAVRKGRPKSITLNEAGSYEFHDHLEPDVAGSFTVSP